jgi:hypothetical protein
MTQAAPSSKYANLTINATFSSAYGFQVEPTSLDPEQFLPFVCHELARGYGKIIRFEVLQATPFIALQPIGVICNGEQQMSNSKMEAEYRLEAASTGVAPTQQGFALFCIKQMTGIQITNA